MAEESVMRQELTSWLKRECSDIGTTMFSALHNVEWAYETAFKLERLPVSTYLVKEEIKTILGGAIDSMMGLPEAILTVEDRRKIFDLQVDINSALETGDTALIRLKLREMEELTKKYLLEKVVECQCGKPPISPAKWEIITPEDAEHIYARGLIVEAERDYLLTELHKGPFTIQDGKITRGAGLGEIPGIIYDTFDVVKRRLDWLYKNQFASFLLYRDSIDEAIKDKEAGKIPTMETLRPFTLDELRSLKEYADSLYYKKE